jgi:hypothetical protein
MINVQELVDVVLEEITTYIEQSSLELAPLTSEERRDRMLSFFPLPDTRQISHVIDEVFWASMLTEEGRPCRPRLLYVPKQPGLRPRVPRLKGGRRAVHRLAVPVALTRATLRKLTPAQGRLGYLSWDCVSGTPEITGVQ